VKEMETGRALADALLGRADLAARDVARESGVEPDELRRLWQALGFPPVSDDEKRFTRADVEVVRAIRAVVEDHDADPSDVLQLTRVIGHAMAAISDAQITVIAERLRTRGEAADAAKLASRIKTLAPSLEEFLGYVWRRHLVAAAVQVSAALSPTDRALVVGFADMVGFTAMTQALDAGELATMVDKFEAIAHEKIVEHGGRVVKMIGDEVMFSADDAVRGAEIALALVEAHAEQDTLPNVRIGVASGSALAWEGDLFGPTVNLASRLVNLARPGAVLLSEELGERLREEPDFELRHLRPVKLKGIGRVRSWVLRSSAANASGRGR
jgi:adenylate cyclase